MSRLGQLLIDAGVITPVQLDEALRAQVLYGGRLGTNLVDLDFVSLDALATALGHLHGMVPALSAHFERCDVAVQERLPAEFAAMHLLVPIGYLADGTNRIAVAMPGPIDGDTTQKLALYLECEPSQIIAAIAGELRLRFYLERCYGIARTSRFLRVRRPSDAHIPIPQVATSPSAFNPDSLFPMGIAEEEPGSSTAVVFPPPPPQYPVGHAGFEVSDEAENPLTPETKRRFVRTISEQVDLAANDQEAAIHGDATPTSIEDLASYATVHAAPPTASDPFESIDPSTSQLTSADVGELAQPAQPIVLDSPPDGEAPSATLGRLGVRRLARALPSDPSDQELETLEQMLRAIRRAQSRERVAELSLAALAKFSPTPLDTVVLFVVREHFAIGWKGIAGDSDLRGLDQVAVDLQELSLLASAHQLGHLVTLAPQSRDPAFVDQRLWQALGAESPSEAAACPVTIGGHSVCLYYAHAAAPLADGIETMRAVADATSTAFARMFRAAQR